MTGQGRASPSSVRPRTDLDDEYVVRAQLVFDRTFSDSYIVDSSHDYPKFEWNEITLGKILGKGGFATVCEVTAFSVEEQHCQKVSRRQSSVKKRLDEADDDVATGEIESRLFIANHCIRNGGDARYAVKVLSHETTLDPDMHCQGMIDMAIEARILCSIEHPNIVKLRAISSKDLLMPGFFFIMDRLYDTLEKRLKKWQIRSQRANSFARILMDRSGLKKASLYEDRIVAAFDLSAALAYLHDRNIIYRDLKPENIGFDIRDDIKIFDFGLSKELSWNQRNDDGTYRLTPMTGSPRYMAPEVANSEPYNMTCDVYSFAILFWEMLTLKIPYELYTPKAIREKVYNGACKRPPVDETWSTSIKILLRRCWEHNLKERPFMSHVRKMLRKEATIARGGDDSALEHSRRRSTFVFRRANSGVKMST